MSAGSKGQTSTEAAQAIVVSRETVNADTVYLVRWVVGHGVPVTPGTVVCEIETSKATMAIEAPGAGYLRHVATAGQEIPIGGILGYLTGEADAPLPQVALSGEATERGSARVSANARRLIAELGLDPSLFDGYRLVRERDVRAVAEARRATAGEPAEARGDSWVEPLGPIQRRVARAMERSAAEIPSTWVERAVDIAPIRARAQVIMGEAKVLVTPLDLLVAAVAQAALKFPRFNASLGRDDELRLFRRVNVGVTVDVDHDLYVVVVKDVAAKSVPSLARELHALQFQAQRRRLTADQMSGGTITVTSLMGRGVHRFQPILYPGQTSIVAMADAPPDSTLASSLVVFDHRVANGSEGAAFLCAIADALQSL